MTDLHPISIAPVESGAVSVSQTDVRLLFERTLGSVREEMALLAVGRIRLRPIIMTTAAMVFGMMPLALAIGGLITSTLLTLVVVPVMYTLLKDGVAYVRHQVPALLRRRPSAPPVVGPLRPVPGVDAPVPAQPAAVYKFQPKDRTDVA